MKTMTPLSVMMAFLMPSGLMSQIATPALYKQVAPAIVLIATNRGGGTGFIVRSDGVIVTALHVVRDATVVRVSTSSGDVFDQVGLLYEDERKDLALLKIFGFDLPVVKLGNSNNAAVGQSIVVVGNPLATQKLQATLSTGVISGIRDFEEGYNVLQITAAISPGSSGAPILSDDGSVIGVAAFKLLGGESLNFGIPINYVRGFLESGDLSKSRVEWTSRADKVSVASNAGASLTGLTGYWKSKAGILLSVEDRGSQIRIVAPLNSSVTYEAEWIEEIVIGVLRGPRGTVERFVVKQVDPDHLQFSKFKFRASDTAEQMKLQALKELQRPDELWTRVR